MRARRLMGPAGKAWPEVQYTHAPSNYPGLAGHCARAWRKTQGICIGRAEESARTLLVGLAEADEILVLSMLLLELLS